MKSGDKNMNIFNGIGKTLDTLLNINHRHLSWYQKLALKVYHILYAVLRDFSDKQMSMRAMSLVYTTLITLVPLLALSFSVLKGFGVHNQIEPTLLNLLEPLGQNQSQEVTGRILSFVDNMRVGVLGVAGLGLLIYTVISLMQKIESALNYIWRVGRGRGFAARLADYLTALLVGPLLIFMSTGITATLRHADLVSWAQQFSVFSGVIELLGVLVPWLVLAIGFSAIYIFMPNTKVRFFPAFIGGLSAALIWKVMGFLFTAFIANSSSYVAVYAAFATIIIFMIWVYLGWFVVLIGANIAFYVQNQNYTRIDRRGFALSPRLIMVLGVSCVSLIGRSYYKNGKGWSIEELSAELNVPVPMIDKVVDALGDGNILLQSGQEPPIFYPACPLEKTPMQTLFAVLERAGETGVLSMSRITPTKNVTALFEKMENTREKQEGSKTIYGTLIAEKAAK
jgi:membrane protein